MTSRRLLLAVATIAALVGGVVGAVGAGFLAEEPAPRGTVLEWIENDLSFEEAGGMLCSPHNRYCLPEYETRSEVRALYMMDTHDYFRRAGCEVEWQPDRDVSDFDANLADEPGAFFGPCSSSVWLRDGTRVTGAAGRDLDAFSVEFDERSVELDDGEWRFDVILIDTRELICGRLSNGERTDDCEFAPAFD